MYHHCPSCTRDLGRNEALEHFPVGKRLAYDVARGRLWALCPRCRSWNLAPIEERWEAVEEAERSFEKSLEGLSTENIALGRLPDGTELVRIGGAKAPELAGWRYAKRISERYRKAQWVGGVSGAGWVLWGTGGYSALLPIVAPALPFAVAGFVGYQIWAHPRRKKNRLEIHRDRADLDDPPSRVFSPAELARAVLVPAPDGGPEDAWGLKVRSFGYRPLVIPPELRNRALRLALLELNKQIGKPDHVKRALDRVVEAGEPERLPGIAARTLADGRAWESHMGWPFGDPQALHRADPVMRLALEIAANEEVERLALEGELYRLELEWKEAEELAAISDDLLLPGWIRSRIDGWRAGGAPRAGGSPPPIATPGGIVDSEGRPMSSPPEPSGDPADTASAPEPESP